MSYVCGACDQPSVSGKPALRLVVSRREKVYPARFDAHRDPHRRVARQEFDPKHDPTIDPGGEGWEIEKEILVCVGCAEAAP